MSSLHEECGIFGVYSPAKQDVARTAYYGLFALQHRGQESCGIVVCDDGVFSTYKDLGLVEEVFTERHLARLGQGNIAVGHVRYGTTGCTDRHNAQPLVVNHIHGHIAIAHNGNITNSLELRSQLELQGSIFHTTSDTEVISYIVTRERITSNSIEEAVERAMYTIKGSYSLVLMSPTKLVIARDPFGFRPLCYGVRDDGTYIAASETCALDSVGAKFVRDVLPGEVVYFDKDGVHSIKTHCGKQKKHICAFEFVYFARPDSVIDGISVHSARVKAGEYLAKSHPVEADIVIGVPDSGLDAAIGYSKESGIPYEIGYIKNKYIGRTFIAPGQDNREDKVKLKLNPVSSVVKGKRVVVIDDSIVRGTTSKKTIKLLRDAGAKEIHMRISSPTFLNPCYYGTDIDSRDYLIACHHSVEEIAKIIGADSLGFLSVENVKDIAGGECCTACFDGSYPTAIPSDTRKSRFENKISDKE
ncbi:MAG: amidophosphoribosyltransferase [Bacilli bacterium]|nr:amidophosphoribosyltransferase [Bacilli bacterium]